MQTYSQTYAGAQTWRLNVPGRYFVIMGCTNAVNVRFYRGGKKLDLGEITNVLAGLEATLGDVKDPTPAFDAIEIDFTAADTVQVGVGNGQVRYNRSQGNVAITNLSGSVANTNPAVTNVSAQILAANASRRYLLIQNKDAAGNVYINFGAAATVANGIKIPPGGSFSADASFCPNNVVNAIGDIANNANVVVVTG